MANKYETLAKASSAAQARGIETIAEYRKLYREDPRLPCFPEKVYAADWVGWYEFLGKERPENYGTLAEVMAVAKALGITSSTEYSQRYREDSRLPVRPEKTYAADWVDWYHFFGKKRPELYETLAEAQAAAKARGITSLREYSQRYREDPRLPSNPNQYYAKGWVDWFDFLGMERPPKLYKTLAEAQVAVQARGIKTITEYKKRYREDSRLPSNPSQVYATDWVDWHDYFGLERPPELYKTLAEAQAAVQALGIATSTEYSRRCRENSRLPSGPAAFYAADWVSWYEFLGTERPPELYRTLAEAQSAAKVLGITTSTEYSQRYREDSRLPHRPEKTYAADWVDWYEFFGRERPEYYETLVEAQAAAQARGFKTCAEYQEHRQEDSRLPSNPSQVYAADWVDWYEFLGTERLIEPDLAIEYPVFWEAITAYMSSGVNLNAKTSHLRAFLHSVVANLGLPDQPGALLSKDIPFPQKVYEEFVHTTGDSRKRQRHHICTAFFDWVLETHCSDVDDEGELVPIPGYRNPLRTVLKGYLDQLPTHTLSESNKPPLPMESILRARHHLIPQEAKTFRDLYELHPFLEDCWFEVDPALVDESDPNCIVRTVNKERGNGTEKRYVEEGVTELWSPVKLVANYALLSMPLRGQQILWLDSGEGDGIIPVWRDGKVCWITNTGPLARLKRNQGFLRRGQDGEPSSYVTTNKTGRKMGGYSVPYMPESLAYWVIQLRDWQSKYNPIQELTPWTKIRLRAPTNRNILENRGKQAFLFRDPASRACVERVSPMFTTTAFTRTVPALLFHSQRPDEGLAEAVQRRKSVDYKSPFTPHSLRVSLITAYIVDGAAPIDVISKLVGHTSLVMTIYYTKVGHTRMREALAEAEKKALERGAERLQDLVIQKKIAEARPELIATDRATIDRCVNSDWPSAAFQFSSIGICPMSGDGCHEGGEVVVKRKAEKVYGPVPVGYLGTRNCPRCRFLLSGPAFLGGLSAIANEIMLEINVVREEYHDLEAQREALDDERYEVERAGEAFKDERKLKRVTAAYEARAKKLDMLLCDFQHLYRLISQSTELLNQAGTDKNQLIVSDQYVEIGMHLQEQQSEFRLLAEVCANAEIYESASAARAKPLLAQMLDKLADANGIAPSLFRLTDEQQLKAANQVVRLIMQTTQNDWRLADQLVSGQIMLEDLVEVAGVESLHKEIESIMHGSLKFPLAIEGSNE
ncbi:gamma-mobile-trio integrase GmtZ [Marinobacter salsuginis]